METYVSDQAIAFLWAVVLGVALGAVYDIFRIGRIFKKRGWLLVFFEDLLFSLAAALSTAFCFTLTNFGQVRLFLLVGEGLGFLLYFNTLGVLSVRLMRPVARLFQAVLLFWRKKMKKIMNFLKKHFTFSKEWCRMLLSNAMRRKSRLEDQDHRKSE